VVEFGMHSDLDAVVAENAPAKHSHDQEVPIRKPPQTGGLFLPEVQNRFPLAVGGDRVHPVLEEVGIPQLSVTPTRAFAEVETIDEKIDFVHG
jgi:hypothetical protein